MSNFLYTIEVKTTSPFWLNTKDRYGANVSWQVGSTVSTYHNNYGGPSFELGFEVWQSYTEAQQALIECAQGKYSGMTFEIVEYKRC
jgi:hypothetical protein